MYRFITAIVLALKRVIPEPLVRPLRPFYHRTLAFLLALSYGFPPRRMTIIGVTGTKGKSSVAEMLFAILRANGKKTALASTIRFAIGEESEPNLFKMTLPGRCFIQNFLARARKKGATHAIIEITSESTRHYRHRFLFLNALIFTNLQREHIESHGSFEKYFEAKLEIAKELERSPKRPRAIIANADDAHGKDFLRVAVEEKVPLFLEEAENLELQERGVAFSYKQNRFVVPHPGRMSVYNALTAIKAAEFLGVPLETAQR